MTHVPYATWCPMCVRAKGKEYHHKTCALKDPAIQVDFNFGGTSGSVMRIILTACDVQTGLISATVVPSKEVTKYSVTFMTNFVMEAGRTCGILISDSEPALKGLVNRVVQEMAGLTKRFAPQYSSKSLGSVGQAQQRLVAQIRALRLQA